MTYNLKISFQFKIKDNMENENNNLAQNPPFYKTDISGSGIRLVILSQAITFLFNSIVWFMKDDLDKWFTRWALGMLLLSAWGIMKHLSRYYR